MLKQAGVMHNITTVKHLKLLYTYPYILCLKEMHSRGYNNFNYFAVVYNICTTPACFSIFYRSTTLVENSLHTSLLTFLQTIIILTCELTQKKVNGATHPNCINNRLKVNIQYATLLLQLCSTCYKEV